MHRVVAIDGPAGSGKSSVSRGVAARSKMRYLDTGAMYRALTLAVLEAGVDPHDQPGVRNVIEPVVVTSGTDPSDPFIRLNGRDVSEPIRSAEVTAAVSAVSAIPEVRARLVDLQRQIVEQASRDGFGIVVEGRDIGTVVLPSAEYKFFLTADETERARRRASERDELDAVERTKEQLARRDALDSNRTVSPLTQAADAHVLDTTRMSLEEVIDAVIAAMEATS